MDSLESLLREEFDAVPSHPRPAVSDLVARTRRLRRRRTATTTSIAAALSVLVIAVVGVLAVRSGTGQPDVADTPNVVDPTRLDNVMRAWFRGGAPLGGGFIDQNNGYLLMATCPELRSLDTCTVSLKVTTDGGASLTDRPPLPMGDGKVHSATLWVFDGGALVLDAVPQNPNRPTDAPTGAPGAVPGDQWRRWASPDGGLTWREMSTQPIGPIGEIPPGARIVTTIENDPSGPFRPTVLTSEGNAYTLTNAPEKSDVFLGVSPYVGANAADEPYFLQNDLRELWVSTDRGRTWQKSRNEIAGQMFILGGHAGRLYAYGVNDPADPPQVWASDDRGRSWHPIPMPELTPRLTPTGENSDDYTKGVSVADLSTGGLLLCDGARLWRLAPGSDTFEPVPYGNALAVSSLGDVAIVLRGDGDRFAVDRTVDGVNFQPTALDPN
jgi:hypothetical protein